MDWIRRTTVKIPRAPTPFFIRVIREIRGPSGTTGRTRHRSQKPFCTAMERFLVFVRRNSNTGVGPRMTPITRIRGILHSCHSSDSRALSSAARLRCAKPFVLFVANLLSDAAHRAGPPRSSARFTEPPVPRRFDSARIAGRFSHLSRRAAAPLFPPTWHFRGRRAKCAPLRLPAASTRTGAPRSG